MDSPLSGAPDYKGMCEVLGERRPSIVYCANARPFNPLIPYLRFRYHLGHT